MSLKEARAQYEFMLESGDLHLFLDDMTEDWDTDKNTFILYYEANISTIDNTETEFKGHEAEQD